MIELNWAIQESSSVDSLDLSVLPGVPQFNAIYRRIPADPSGLDAACEFSPVPILGKN
jgi:hypothetical protein